MAAPVTVLTVGGEGAVPALRSCLAVGAGSGLPPGRRVCLRHPGDCLPAGPGSKKAGEQPFDVIFCGSESTDASSAQVGAQVAELLGLPGHYQCPGPGAQGRRHFRQAGDRGWLPRGGGTLPLRGDHCQAGLTSPVIPPSRARWRTEDAHYGICPWRCGSRCRQVWP